MDDKGRIQAFCTPIPDDPILYSSALLSKLVIHFNKFAFDPISLDSEKLEQYLAEKSNLEYTCINFGIIQAVCNRSAIEGILWGRRVICGVYGDHRRP